MDDLIDKVDGAVAELDGVRNELDDFGDDVHGRPGGRN